MTPRPPKARHVHVSILIPTHNRCELLARTLESIALVRVPDGVTVDALIVANACTDDTAGVAERGLAALPFAGRVVVEDTPGLNVARTRAVAETAGDICALLDDDVWLDEQWLAGLHDAFTTHDADMVGGRVELWWEEIQRPNWLPDRAVGLLSANEGRGDKVEVLTAPWGIIGANFAFRRSVFDHIGGFQPGLDRVGNQLLGSGEIEFVQRAQAAGFRAVYAPRAKVKHWVPASRVTRQYLTGVAYGNGVSQILIKPRLPPARFLRAVAGHLVLIVGNSLGLIHARLKGDKTATLDRQCLIAIGRGGLAGLMKRLLGRGPAAPGSTRVAGDDGNPGAPAA